MEWNTRLQLTATCSWAQGKSKEQGPDSPIFLVFRPTAEQNAISANMCQLQRVLQVLPWSPWRKVLYKNIMAPEYLEYWSIGALVIYHVK